MATGPRPNRRKFPRSKYRIPCRVRLPDGTGPGFVLDLSAEGLFVQTGARAVAGTSAQLTLTDPSGASVEVAVIVVRRRDSHRSIAAVRPKGLAFRVESAPEAYYQMVLDYEQRRGIARSA